LPAQIKKLPDRTTDEGSSQPANPSQPKHADRVQNARHFPTPPPLPLGFQNGSSAKWLFRIFDDPMTDNHSSRARAEGLGHARRCRSNLVITVLLAKPWYPVPDCLDGTQSWDGR